MIKIWVKEDLYVTLVYCGVVEEYTVQFVQHHLGWSYLFPEQ